MKATIKDLSVACVGLCESISKYPEKAQRILDCYKACEGINPEAVPGILSACEAALILLENPQSYIDAKTKKYHPHSITAICNAIAKAKGASCTPKQ